MTWLHPTFTRVPLVWGASLVLQSRMTSVNFSQNPALNSACLRHAERLIMTLTQLSQRIIMFYQGTNGTNSNARITVIMADESTAKAAVDELDGAPLFHKRLDVRPYKRARDEPKQQGKPLLGFSFTWGWVASRIPAWEHMDRVIRAPIMGPPKGIFRPVREGRRVVVDVPQPSSFNSKGIYALFYSYNVDSVSHSISYEEKGSKLQRTCWHVDFSSLEEADDAIRVLNGTECMGTKVRVTKWQIPLKYLGASWDSGRPGEHFSGRDQGSAVGTNYEYVSLAPCTSVILHLARPILAISLRWLIVLQVQEELLAKAILGVNNRKLWVPTHTY